MLPLTGVRVVDLSRVLTGPFATMILSDFGAEVTKVEARGTGDDTRTWAPPYLPGGESCYFAAVNRGKRSLTLDLKHPKGKEVLRRLLTRADVLVENFRPGVMEALGFGPESCRALNPALVYARISAYGESGPYRDLPGYDVIVQGLSGLQATTGEEGGGPVRVGFSVGDLGAGMYAVMGILLALLRRRETGEGGVVRTTLLGTLLSWQTYHAMNVFATGREPGRLGSRHPNIVPYQAFAARDGWFNVAVGNEPMWRRFCRAIGLPELVDDERFRTNPDRVRHREPLVAILSEHFAGETVRHWVERLAAEGVAVGPVLGVGAAWEDPGAAALGLRTFQTHPSAGAVPAVRTPIDAEGLVALSELPPPRLGEHTRAVLGELGYTDDEIRDLEDQGVV